MKVKADFSKCESNGVCAAFAPDVFELDDNNFLVILNDEVSAGNEAVIRQAVAGCPTQALSIVEG